MVKTDWKAKASALKKWIKSLSGGSEAGKAQVAALISPLAPKDGFPVLPKIKGAAFCSIEAGVRYKNRKDVMLVRLAPGTTVAGVFTKSATRAACILDAQAKLAKGAGKIRQGAAIVVNSGNSNAFTGRAGVQSVDAISQSVATALDLPVERVFSSSTGVIGEVLPHDRIVAVVADLAAGLSEGKISQAAQAIMTTDTFPKGASAVIAGDGGPIHISGIAKGSGMIAPDMATMLVYIFTDAKISALALQKMLSRQVDRTFNAITVDSDTSTSDALFLAATGQSEAAPLAGQVAKVFEAALADVMLALAHQVVRDGEGATKFVEVRVTGAKSDIDAKKVAMAIANSPLVKTAIAGEDPNWGRIVMAVGKSGAAADRDRLTIHFGDILVAQKGQRHKAYSEERAAAYMKQDELFIGVNLGLGRGETRVWTCDLTNRYIEINADYRS